MNMSGKRKPKANDLHELPLDQVVHELPLDQALQSSFSPFGINFQ